MRFDFFNDTGREVRIHPATFEGGCEVAKSKAVFLLLSPHEHTTKGYACDCSSNIIPDLLIYE